MFEQSTLASGPASKRVWTVCMGLTGEALLVVCAAVAPMIWPQVLPRAGALFTRFSAPGAPAGEVKREVEQPRAHAAPPKPFQLRDGALTLPRVIPVRAAIIDEPPLEGPPSVGTGDGIGVGNGVKSVLLNDILREGAPAVRPPRVERAPAPARPASAAVPRYQVGGLVQMARPVSQPQPQYPRMALVARVSGEVKLEAVIGVDGRIRELKVMAGNPLLVPAAVDAVRRWVYEPTKLNGEPVEVIAPITVKFTLN